MKTKIVTGFATGILTAATAGASGTAASAPGGRFAQVGDLKMYYEVHGRQGDPVVLIHGGGSTIDTSFGAILPQLAARNTVIAVELQGHGHTPDRNAPESFEQDADDVAGLVQSLHIRKATFFGFSNGGNTAIQIAIRHPGLVDRLILASTFYRRDGLVPGFFEGMQHATLDAMPTPLKDAFLHINPDPNRLQTMFNKDKQRMLRFVDWTDEALRSIDAPTLIINGDQDVILTEHALRMSKVMPRARLLVLPTTHGGYLGVAEGSHVDRTLIAVTTAAVQDFLGTN